MSRTNRAGMTTKARRLLALCLFVGGCLTVNVYFPAPEVRNAAEKIVQETWGDGSATQAEPDAAGSSWYRVFMPSVAYAADVDINVSTAAIRMLKAQIAARAGELKPHLRSGALGIANSGLLTVRDLGKLGLRDQAQVRRLVDAENSDRESLYKEIATANDLSDVGRIQTIFAETWIANAEKGWWVQAASGSWSQK